MDLTVRILTLLLLVPVAVLHAGEELVVRADAAMAHREAFVAGEGGWRFLPAELRFAAALASPEIGTKVAPAVVAISDFAAQLRALGIKLIVVPVPPKALLQGASLGLSPHEQEAMRSGWEKIMVELGSHEVTVVDLAPGFASLADNPYCLRDTHWSGDGVSLAVAKILPLLEHAGLEVGHPAGAPPGDWTEKTITGDLGGEPEQVRLQFRNFDSNPAETKEHPLLLVGDSHLLVFHSGGDMHAAGAGLPDQLAAALGAMPDVIGVRGSGATSSRVALARRARSDTAYLSGKKVVVWCFAGREFTEADSWKMIPIQRKTP
ncbi:MAG: hypothetical protein IAE97_03465 [Chthoniobacterales bacterium]|nr:hypothetical protein [Chthoniobacterales bacterium]